jgi:hypothetical protein
MRTLMLYAKTVADQLNDEELAGAIARLEVNKRSFIVKREDGRPHYPAKPILLRVLREELKKRKARTAEANPTKAS